MNINEIVSSLKEIIDKNGQKYLGDKPFEVYNELIKEKKVDNEIAASLLHIFLCFTPNDFIIENDVETCSEMIQDECNFDKESADYFAKIMMSLFSKEHKKEWKKNELAGFKSFLTEEFNVEWDGFSVWDAGTCTLDCKYEATIILKPTEKIMKNDAFLSKINNNPFLTKEFINDYFYNSLTKCLDEDFNEYCTCDDYYEPCAEDYYGNIDSTIEKWCDENGFQFVSCEGEGETGTFEPKSYRHYW